MRTLRATTLIAIWLTGWLAVAAEPRRSGSATPDDAWDVSFARTRGWTGGDCAATVDLRDDRILWLFGDSWIGDVVDGRHPPGTPMVHNAIAIQSHAAGGLPPAKNDLQFFWRSGNKKPEAWITPEPSATAGRDARSAASQTTAPQTAAPQTTESRSWYWPSGGAVLLPGKPPPGSLAKPRLIVFLFHIAERDGKQGVWGFKSLGSSMAIIDNPREPVEKWRAKQFEIPFAIGADEAAKPAAGKSPRRETSWGVAACLGENEKGSETVGDGWLYIFGVRNDSPLNRQLLLARAKIDSPARFERWEFFAGRDRWSASADEAAPVIEGVANELSIERLPATERSPDGRPKWIMVHSEPALGARIFVRSADRPEGEWSERKEVYFAPETRRKQAYFEYAAKGHFCISPPGQLLISYVVGATDLGSMAADASIYRPRFILVPLAKIWQH